MTYANLITFFFGSFYDVVPKLGFNNSANLTFLQSKCRSFKFWNCLAFANKAKVAAIASASISRIFLGKLSKVTTGLNLL